MSVILGCFIIMAVVSFNLPWGKLEKQDPARANAPQPLVAGEDRLPKAAPAPAEQAKAPVVAERGPDRAVPPAVDPPVESPVAPPTPVAMPAKTEEDGGPPVEPRFEGTPLFDGGSLAAWQITPAAGRHWKKLGDTLTFRGGAKVDLPTRRSYRNFLLRAEWRLGPGADSGIYLRGVPQVQIWDPARPQAGGVGSGGLYNNKMHPSRPSVKADRPIGEWNTMTIRMIDQTVWVWLNGQLVVDGVILENNHPTAGPLPDRGPIVLQGHSGEVAFRDIYVQELPDDAEAENALALGTSASSPSEPTFVPLFNGVDLSGWEQFRTVVLRNRPKVNGRFQYRIEPTQGAWKAQAGQIVCVSRGENSGGFIRTARRFSDFVLRLEFRIPPDCNSKLRVRMPEIDLGSVQQIGLDDLCTPIQIVDDYSPKRNISNPTARTGAVYRFAGSSHSLLRPNGHWNEMEVRCEGDRVRVVVNGEQSADISVGDFPELRGRPRSGYIALMCFGEQVDGPWFRKIEIAELADHRVQP